MRVKILVLLCLVLLLTGCVAPSVAPNIAVSPAPSVAPNIAVSSAPSVAPNIAISPAPTVVPAVKSTPTPSPEPTLKPTLKEKEIPQMINPPPELGERKKEFRKGIDPIGSVYNEWGVEGSDLWISIDMAYDNGVLRDARDFYYGDPPRSGYDLWQYLSSKYSFMVDQGLLYEDENFDPSEIFFEADVLNRDDVFFIYDYNGSKCLGSGRIAKTPMYCCGDTDSHIEAVFKMDDPNVKLDVDRWYLALPGKWDPRPRSVVWDKTGKSFSIDIDGKGSMVKGTLGERRRDGVTDDMVESYGIFSLMEFVNVQFKGKTEEIDLGLQSYEVAEGNPQAALEDYQGRIHFCDYNGDGVMEMSIYEDYQSGYKEKYYSFTGKKMKLINYMSFD